MTIPLPELSLVVLMGPSGSGKSSFAARHFKPTEVVSSDVCRGLICDDTTNQDISKQAFELVRYIARKRLAAGRLTVIDATNVQADSRKPFVALARELHVLPVAIVLDLPHGVCHERNQQRPDRDFGAHVTRNQSRELKRSLKRLKREGFRQIQVLSTPEEIDAAQVERRKLWNNKRDEHGPFDIIGDIHGCYVELIELIEALGWRLTGDRDSAQAHHPDPRRRLIFLGDLVDRGPDSPGVLKLVMSLVASGAALCVPGNHEVKLLRKLNGRDVKPTHGLAETLEQLARETPEFSARVREFIDGLVSHYVLDDGELVVAHAGLSEELQGRASGRVRSFALWGETTGETDEFGLPIRYNWAADYRGRAVVVYGHTPVPEANWLNRTICIDTGCVFGGRLTALRYPERELVDVPAKRVHYESIKPFLKEDLSRERGDLLDIGDVSGRRVIETRLRHRVTLREENAAAALELMSRFAVDPRWLVYLPPTMSPTESAKQGELLEQPADAFAYYRANRVSSVVCQEKHMGSRAVVVLCRDEAIAERRFGVAGDGRGRIVTRTGRPFFAAERGLEAELLARLDAAVETSGLWSQLDSGWLVLDCELLPWSAKAQELLKTQYAAVGSASVAALTSAVERLDRAAKRGGGQAVAELLERTRARLDAATRYVEAYGRYCWSVSGLDELKLAPFQLLASEGRVHTDRDHVWHMKTLARLADADPRLIKATGWRLVDLEDPESEAAATSWWRAHTDAGGEGMVVKPRDWLVQGKKGLIQPAIKCRGREYLRIIYGPEYTLPRNLERLRARSLGRKRSLALRELALGLEALHRFVEREPLHRVHECVFGVLALESEPVDPRL